MAGFSKRRDDLERLGDRGQRSGVPRKFLAWEAFEEARLKGWADAWVGDVRGLPRQLITSQVFEVRRVLTEFGYVPLSETQTGMCAFDEHWISYCLRSSSWLFGRDTGKWIKKKKKLSGNFLILLIDYFEKFYGIWSMRGKEMPSAMACLYHVYWSFCNEEEPSQGCKISLV